MPSFLNNTFASYYNRIFQVSQTTNTGVDATTRQIQTGDGVNTCASISDDVFGIQPQNDDTTSTYFVKKNNGNKVFDVDTTNSLVKVGTEQVSSTFIIKEFSSFGLVPVAGSHMVLPSNPSAHFGTTTTEENLGTGTDPDTSKDMSAGGDSAQWTGLLWYLPNAITIDAVHVFMASLGTPASALNYHLMSYDIDTTNGATSGDLSSGTVLADGSAISGVDRTAIDYQSLTIQSSDVASGKVIFATMESDTTQSISVNMTVKYHIQ